MSKRSISRKISINHLNFPSPESSNHLPNSRGSDKYGQDAYFGEQITDTNISSSTNSNSTDNYSSSDDVCDIVSYSGSSTSGEDDIEIEATKRIQSEFDKLNNILYGGPDTSAPPNDDNEYNQWIEKFPHLRVVGSAVKIYECPEEHLNFVEPDYEEEIIAEHSECSCCSATNPIQLNKSKIKEAVINSVLKEINAKMTKSQSDFKISISKSTPRRKEKRRTDTRPSYDLEDAEVNEIIPTSQNFLQISASTLSMHSPSLKQPNFEYQSPILKSQLSASKWQREDSVDYASLPYISNSNSNSINVPYSNANTGRKSSGPFTANKSAHDLHRHEAGSSSRNRSMTAMKLYNNNSSKTRNVILPPIQNLNIEAERATPKKYRSTDKFKYTEYLAKH